MLMLDQYLDHCRCVAKSVCFPHSLSGCLCIAQHLDRLVQDFYMCQCRPAFLCRIIIVPAFVYKVCLCVFASELCGASRAVAKPQSCYLTHRCT